MDESRDSSPNSLIPRKPDLNSSLAYFKAIIISNMLGCHKVLFIVGKGKK